MKLIKRTNGARILASFVLALMFLAGAVSAQSADVGVFADIPKDLVPLAQELGCGTKAECAEKFDANLEVGIDLAQKYGVYTSAQQKVATSFKAEVLDRLSAVSQDNFEEEVLALANKILKEKPALARTIGVTKQTVEAAQTIVNTVKEAGVDVRTCHRSPEELSREQLIACVKASTNLSSKGDLSSYIPIGNSKAQEAEKILDLEEALLAGDYLSLGKVTSEEAGQICLRPGSESVVDCDRIAEKFFGAEGIKHLRKAREQVNRAREYYTEGIAKMELMTPSGERIIGKDAIRNACDRAFKERNLGLARACGNFAVKNGYAEPEDIEDGLKLLETFSQKGEGKDFTECRFDPQSCRDILPTEFQSQFDSQFQIFKIMSESIGFDPSRCENTYDPEIGKRCLEGAKKALSQVEEIAQNSPEARKIVEGIRSHIVEGERMTEKLNKFHQNSQSVGRAGPGNCTTPEECFRYCDQPINSAECISFGAKSQIFDPNTVVQKFNIVNESLNSSSPDLFDPSKSADGKFFQSNFRNTLGQFRQDSNYNPNNNNIQSRYPPNIQYPSDTSYAYPPSYQPSGPSPECFTAISSGDFARAKTACYSNTANYPKPIAEPFPVCPTSMPSPCPNGEIRQQATDYKGCLAYGACASVENYKPTETTRSCPAGQYWNIASASCVTYPEPSNKNICPMMPTVASCPTGQEKYEVYSSPECGKYYACRSVILTTPDQNTDSISNNYSTSPSVGCAQAGGTWNSFTNFCQMPNTNNYNMPVSSCTFGQHWNGSACVSSTTSSNNYTPPPSNPNTSPSYTPPPAYPAATPLPPPASETPPLTTPPPPLPLSSPPPPSAMLLCSQFGGSWTGSACNLAKNISNQQAYYNHFYKQSDTLLTQALRAFTDLFR